MSCLAEIKPNITLHGNAIAFNCSFAKALYFETMFT